MHAVQKRKNSFILILIFFVLLFATYLLVKNVIVKSEETSVHDEPKAVTKKVISYNTFCRTDLNSYAFVFDEYLEVTKKELTFSHFKPHHENNKYTLEHKAYFIKLSIESLNIKEKTLLFSKAYQGTSNDVNHDVINILNDNPSFILHENSLNGDKYKIYSQNDLNVEFTPRLGEHYYLLNKEYFLKETTVNGSKKYNLLKSSNFKEISDLDVTWEKFPLERRESIKLTDDLSQFFLIEEFLKNKSKLITYDLPDCVENTISKEGIIYYNKIKGKKVLLSQSDGLLNLNINGIKIAEYLLKKNIDKKDIVYFDVEKKFLICDTFALDFSSSKIIDNFWAKIRQQIDVFGKKSINQKNMLPTPPK